jgi:hypothetical protein
MIDPLVSLTFAIYSSPGAYALLLGSGVSRAAGVPTGWEIVSDLAKRVAIAGDEDAGGDPIGWFREKQGEEPDYSKMLESLAAEPTERQLLLRRFFEPSEEEREQGIKVPTAAHRAIARLVKTGRFRVIITTNFDRLLEIALVDEGVVPTVIATADDATGALPLVHSDCTILKVHGDYLDSRLRNTPTELQTYEQPIDALLDRILDEYGLVISGWSADWDTALRNALSRNPSRRFTTYWTTRNDLIGFAKGIAIERRAVVIRVADADSLFKDLEEKVLSLERIDAGHPLSPRLAAETLKRYLPEDRHRIRLFDLLMDEVTQVEAAVSLEHLPVDAGIELTRDSYLRRLERYEETTKTLVHLLAVGGFWGEEKHDGLWVNIIDRLANRPIEYAGLTALVNLQRYPAVLALYALGMGNVAADDLGALAAVLARVQVREHGEQEPIANALPLPGVVHEDTLQSPTDRQLFTPASDRIVENVLREPLRQYLPHNEQYFDAFDTFEYLLSHAYFDRSERDGDAWAPVGRFGWSQRRRRENNIYAKVEQDARAAGDDWSFLRHGMFDGSVQRFLNVAQLFFPQIQQAHWR